jgi:hypothetical protein
MKFDFAFPATVEPSWSKQVDRWYQLDASAFGLAQFYSLHQDTLGKKPNLILLASPGASNDTDFDFASTGATSPAKFVHTLPNIRVSPLLQVMNHAVPVICIQNDPNSFETALIEAKFLLPEFKCIWIFSVRGNSVIFEKLDLETKDTRK